MAFVPLARTGHGASCLCKGDWGVWMLRLVHCCPNQCCARKEETENATGWANISLLICLSLICQVHKLRARE